MPKFSNKSLKKLGECHQDLQLLFNYVIRHRDCSILVGHRTAIEQNIAFVNGYSKLDWPNSKHNKKPSEGIDVSPFPLDWEDTISFYFFAGFVMACANMLYELGLMKHKLRFGGDWDSDNDLHDQTLMDLVHFELIIE